MSLSVGTQLGMYEITATLGIGGMGEVYRAKDRKLHRDIALKILPSAFATDPDRLARFHREAQTLAALNHPNILAIHDIGQHDGSPYIVFELLEGETLRARLTAGALPVRKVVEYGVAVARGLAAAHEKGIVHRDLKPDNIFVTTDGSVKILDFGLAKLTHAEPAVSHLSALPTAGPRTEAGVMLGTIGYMAPEQVRGTAADARSDIFAMGAVLYELLSGQRPFEGGSPADTMAQILKEDPPQLPVAERRIPPTLNRIVNRCLEKNPANRFHTAADLMFAIEEVASQLDVYPARDAPLNGRPARRELLAWSLVAIVSGFCGLLAWDALNRGAPAEELAVRATVLLPENWSSVGINPASRMAVSPDGQRLAFAARGPDRRQMLWIRSLDASTPRALEGTEGASLPFWSPDGLSVGFFAAGRLKKIDASGGPAVTLTDAPSIGDAPLGGTWNRDGVILFGRSGSGLQRVSALGGAPVAVTMLQGQEDAHQLPFFLPDGQRFLFRVLTGTRGTVAAGTEVRIGSLVSTEVRPLLKGVSHAMYAQGHLLFGRDDSLVAQVFDPQRLDTSGEPIPLARQMLSPSGYGAFSVSQNGVLAHQDATIATPSRLVWVNRDGKELATLGEEAHYADVQLSADGKHAAVSLPLIDSNSRDVWIFDLARGFPTRFTFDAADELAAIWSPDGGRVVFNSRRGGRLNLFERASTMVGDETVLLFDSDDKIPLSWSPDGRFVLYSSTKGGDEGLWILPLFGDKKPFPFAQSTFSETSGQFSPNGKWIAYRSTESGRAEIWTAPFPGPGKRTQISTEGATGFPRWRGDGTELYYLDADARLIAAQVRDAGSELQVAAVQPLFESRAKLVLRYPYDVSAEGQRFLINRISGQDAPPITLVVNWPALLKK